MAIEWTTVRDIGLLAVGLATVIVRLLPRRTQDFAAIKSAMEAIRDSDESGPSILLRAAHYRTLRLTFFRDRSILTFMQGLLVMFLGLFIMEVGRPYTERIVFVFIGGLVVFNGVTLISTVYMTQARSRQNLAWALHTEEQQLMDHYLTKYAPARNPKSLEAKLQKLADKARIWLQAHPRIGKAIWILLLLISLALIPAFWISYTSGT